MKRVGRHDDLVALVHHPQFDISTQDEPQRIEAIAAADAVARADIVGIILLEALHGFPLQIASAS